MILSVVHKWYRQLKKCWNKMSSTTAMKEEKKIKIQWYSDPFYTHNKGYKMCLRIDAAGVGEGKGTHLSVFLYLMKGPHDDELTWPLRGKFEIKLLNQISDSEHHSGTVAYNDYTTGGSDKRVMEGERVTLGWGIHKLISNEDLNKITPTHVHSMCTYYGTSLYRCTP